MASLKQLPDVWPDQTSPIKASRESLVFTTPGRLEAKEFADVLVSPFNARLGDLPTSLRNGKLTLTFPESPDCGSLGYDDSDDGKSNDLKRFYEIKADVPFSMDFFEEEARQLPDAKLQGWQPSPEPPTIFPSGLFAPNSEPDKTVNEPLAPPRARRKGRARTRKKTHLETPKLPQLIRPTFKPKKRKRVRNACVACNRRKVQCNGVFPCATCIKHGVADTCVKFVPDPSTKARSNKRALARIGKTLLSDSNNAHPGRPCYRNPDWCVRKFKHAGHCTKKIRKKKVRVSAK